MALSFLLASPALSQFYTEEMEGRVAPIRRQVEQIDARQDYRVKVVELWESTEGGEARYFYQGDSLRRIIRYTFWESGNTREEFYLAGGRLIFVLEKEVSYNRPLFYDSLQMVENRDTQYHHPRWFEEVEVRSWFRGESLIHHTRSDDCGAPWAEEYLREESRRLTAGFRDLLARRPLK